jgi:carbon storage regulator CsrA
MATQSEGLVLGRRVGESIFITCKGEVIRIQVASIQGQQVKLHFIAAREVIIDREEIFIRRQREVPR